MKTRKSIKKALSMLVVLVIVVSLTATFAWAEETLVCNVGYAHVRTGPGTEYPSYGYMYQGELFQRTGGTSPWIYGYATWVSSLYEAYGYAVYGYTYGPYYALFTP